MKITEKALCLLDSIEKIEMRSLEWGYTDGSLSEDEASDIANAAVGAAGGLTFRFQSVCTARNKLSGICSAYGFMTCLTSAEFQHTKLRITENPF